MQVGITRGRVVQYGCIVLYLGCYDDELNAIISCERFGGCRPDLKVDMPEPLKK